jgi:ribokinase
MGSKPIVVYGDLVTDVVMHVERLPVEANRVQNIRSISIEPGGAGNSLIVAARLGARAVALGTIGEDGNGQQVYDILHAEGVDVTYVQRGSATQNMTVLVLVDDAGEHVFLVHEGHGENLRLDSLQRTVIREAGVFFIPGYALHEPRVGPIAPEAIEIAVAAGVPVMSDLGPIVGDTRYREASLMVLRASAVTLLTEEEACTFSGQLQGDAAAAALLAVGAGCVVLKRGGEGCVVYRPAQPAIRIPGIPVKAIDTSGAGDSFAAGFMADWLLHGDIERAARFANAVGAAKVQKRGTGRQMPTRAEIEALL